jgi:hypothetical protein
VEQQPREGNIGMIKPKYSIGEKVWLATTKMTRKFLPCPDCFGKLCLRVILGDDSEVTIPCCTCAEGYYPPTGTTKAYEFEPEVLLDTVRGIEVQHDNKVEYSFANSCRVGEEGLFSLREEAEVRAIELTRQRKTQEEVQINRKCKPNRSWA